MTAPYEESLVRSLEPDELRRAFAIVLAEFLRELGRAKPKLAERLQETVGELAR